MGEVFDSVSTSHVPNRDSLNRNSNRTCSFSNSSCTTSSGWRFETARKSRPSEVRDNKASRSALGIAFGQEDRARDGLGFSIPLAEGPGVLVGETRDVGNRFLEFASQDERGAIAMGLAEFVARRDIGNARVEPEVLEPGRLGDVEVIDRVQVVVEARQRDLART